MTSASLVLAAILAVLAGSALAQDNPPAAPVETAPVLTVPAVASGDSGALNPSSAPIAVPAPQTTPALMPVPGLQVRTMLLKHVRTQLVPTRKVVWRLQSLMGLRRSHGGNIWNLGSPEAGKQRLHVWQKQKHRLLLTARQRINSLMSETNYMNHVMGASPARVLSRSLSVTSRLAQELRDNHRTKQHYYNPPHKAALMCIHRFEGSWTDPNAPFWGGLQMNLGFQAHYGGWLLRTKGTADHWTELEQIWTAEKAIPSRGFYPWPNTARYCGLI